MNPKTKILIFSSIIIIQTILMLGVGIWAITQKVEAEKQRASAIMAQQEAEKQKIIVEKLKEEIENIKK